MGFTNLNPNKNKYFAVPEELKGYKNWVCWQSYPDPKSHSGISKKPINPKTGGLAQSNNPDTWSDFEMAVRESAKYSGIGFMFSNSPFFGVDLDDMPNDIQDYQNGGADNIISEFVNTLQSYAEFSQSKAGVHIICKGTLPEGRRKAKNDSGGFEMYENGRFFVVTGDYCSAYAYINDCTESIKPLHSKYLGKATEPQPKLRSVEVNPNTVDDIVRIACNAKNGSLFKALYSGDFSAYSSQSEADMAFCNMLAFWCGCDTDKMDSIFRQSGLMRDKWDRKQSGTTYGIITLQKAVSGCTQTYNPKQHNDYSISIGEGKAVQAVDEEKIETGKFASDRLQPFKSSTPLSDSYIRTQCCCTVTIRRHCFVGTHLLSYDTEPVVSTNVCRISLANFRHRYIFILIGVFHQRYYTEKEDVVNMDTQSIGEIRA